MLSRFGTGLNHYETGLELRMRLRTGYKVSVSSPTWTSPDACINCNQCRNQQQKVGYYNDVTPSVTGTSPILCMLLFNFMWRNSLQTRNQVWSRKKMPLLTLALELGMVTMVMSTLLASGMGERGVSPRFVIQALRHAGHINKRQSFGTCSQSQVASILSGYPSSCQSRLQSLDLSALERGDLDELEEVYDFFCAPRCGQPLVNAFCRCGFETDAELVIQACSVNAHGQRCTQREEIEPLAEALTEAESLCLPYIPRARCSPACKAALEAARDLGGCCVNLFNITRTDLVEIDEYALWASCDVDTPGFCGGSTLSPSGNCNEIPSGPPPTPNPDITTPSGNSPPSTPNPDTTNTITRSGTSQMTTSAAGVLLATTTALVMSVWIY